MPSAAVATPVEQPSPPKSVDIDPVSAEIDRALGDYQRRLVEEEVSGEAPGVEVRMRLDGELVEVDVAEHVPIRYGMDGMSELIVRAAREASTAAAKRRAHLALQVTFFGEFASQRVQAIVEDPEGSLDDLSAVRYW